jgi:predicted nucleic acid binding AN1-type Zn finger protein
MSEVCSKCNRIVGKLSHTCAFCHVRYCEDCVSPKNHFCPTYDKRLSCDYCGKEEQLPLVCKRCNDRFCAEHHLPKKHDCTPPQPPQPPKPENKVWIYRWRDIEQLIASGKGTLDTYICPRCKSTKDMDRYTCIHCKTERTIKCDWCGNHFCEACIKPERHDCLEYEHELRKSCYIEPPEELVNKNEQRPLIDTSSNERTTIAPEQSQPLIKTKDQNSIDDGSKVEVKEELQSENKVSLWSKILSKFGFSK